jgi:mono/diheme cytochrome c family protein
MRLPRHLLVSVITSSVVLATVGQKPAAAQNIPLADMTGRQLYVAACQSCHGADGRGASQAQVGFRDELPDFTDCSYNSREAAQDWHAVVEHGGPVRRFSRRMPSFSGALTSDDIDRVVDHVRSLCDDRSWPRGELNVPRATDTEKAFPEDETVVAGSFVNEPGARVATTTMIYEKRFGARNQWEIAVPISMQESEQGWSGVHLGDVEIALKRALFHNGDIGYIISAGVEAILPTGDHDLGYGDGTVVYGGYLAAAQALPANFFLQMQSGAEFPAKKQNKDKEWFARGVFGTTIFALGGRAISPMAEFVASRPFGVTDAVTTTDWIPQLQIALTRRQHILANVGVRLPISDRGARSREFVVYILWDWFDGGLFTGW